MEFTLSKKDRKDIDGALDEEELKPKIRRKLMALKMRDTGVPLGMIASSLNVSVRSISNYRRVSRGGT